jgi:hypothetical protein
MEEPFAQVGACSPGRASKSLFDAVGERLFRLVSRFGVDDEKDRILAAYRLICGESLAMDAHRRPPEFSRINADGTPIQLSLSFTPSGPSVLQFLGESGVPGSTNGERIALSRERIHAVAALLGAQGELEATADLMRRMAPERDPALLADRSGVYWIGVGFPRGHAPACTVYINSKWGGDADRWSRTSAFADWFGAGERWRSIEKQLRPRMTPLGAAITIAADRPVTGRVYATAYGLPFAYYRSRLTDLCADEAARFADTMLGEDCRYPIRSTACSFEFGAAQGIIGAKFELCAHCAFASDAEAVAKCTAWLGEDRQSAALYADTVAVLIGDRPFKRSQRPELHSYVGIGARGGQMYSSIYLNPGPYARANQ